MSVFGLFERRGLEGTAPLTSTKLLEWLGGQQVDSGVTVSETSALGMSGVYRATSLIASVSAALPLHTYRDGTRERMDTLLLANPHPDLTSYDLWKLTYVHRCLWGNAYLQKLRDRGGRIRELWPITPDRVQVGRVRPSEANPTGKVFSVVDEWGASHVLTSYEVLHIPGLGYDGVTGVSPVRVAAQGIGLAMAAEKYGAKLFGSGNLLQGFLQTEQRLNQEQAETLQARWRAKMAGLGSAHEVAVLDSGASFQSLTMPNDDAQLLESRRFQVTELARYFGVPPFLLMETEKSTSWGTGLEQQAVSWVTFDLHPQWLAPTEQRITKELVPDRGYAKYSVEGLLRGDSAARAAFYTAMRDVGAFSPNDILELEDRPPVDGGDIRLQPLNMAPLGTLPDDDNEVGDDSDPDADDE